MHESHDKMLDELGITYAGFFGWEYVVPEHEALHWAGHHSPEGCVAADKVHCAISSLRPRARQTDECVARAGTQKQRDLHLKRLTCARCRFRVLVEAAPFATTSGTDGVGIGLHRKHRLGLGGKLDLWLNYGSAH